MRRRSVLRELAKSIAGVAPVSLSPDLPNLLTGPDVLIGGARHTIALFEPTQAEVATPGDLLARLALSRLALPRDTQCVLILSESAHAIRLSNLATPHFHRIEVFETDVPARFDRILSGGNVDPHHPKIIPDGTRRLVFGRSMILSDIRELPEEQRVRTTLLSVSSSLTLAGGYAASAPRRWMDASPAKNHFSFLEKEDSIIALPSIHNERRPSIADLRSLCLTGVQLNYTLDDGVPYPLHLTTNVLLTQDIPQVIGDPFKVPRALAFAGWAILPPTTIAGLELTLRTLRRRLTALERSNETQEQD